MTALQLARSIASRHDNTNACRMTAKQTSYLISLIRGEYREISQDRAGGTPMIWDGGFGFRIKAISHYNGVGILEWLTTA